MSQRGKWKTKVSWSSIHDKKLEVFSRRPTLCAFSTLV